MIEVVQLPNGKYVVVNTLTGIILSREHSSYKRAVENRNKLVRKFNNSMRSLGKSNDEPLD